MSSLHSPRYCLNSTSALLALRTVHTHPDVVADAVVNSGVPGATDDEVAQVMAAIADRVMTDIQQPYSFPSLHTRILQPYDYYKFGQVRLQCLRLLTAETAHLNQCYTCMLRGAALAVHVCATCT